MAPSKLRVGGYSARAGDKLLNAPAVGEGTNFPESGSREPTSLHDFRERNAVRDITVLCLKSKAQKRQLAPRAGLEPATIRLTVECSTS
jgi:hypothetical protein